MYMGDMTHMWTGGAAALEDILYFDGFLECNLFTCTWAV